jgi:hypothetical protein
MNVVRIDRFTLFLILGEKIESSSKYDLKLCAFTDVRYHVEVIALHS